MIVSDTYVAYDVHGTGEPVLLIAPAGTRAAIWLSHLVPALRRGGYQVITFDNRGTAPSAVPPGPYRLADLVADTADLIAGLGVGPCRIVGASLGAMVAQELAAAQPGLVRAAVLLGTRCRSDFFRRELTRATAARIRDPDPTLTTDFDVLVGMGQMFSARTLADDKTVANWFAVLSRFPVRGPGAAAQYEATLTEDRAAALASVRCPCLVVGFSEDAITPPALCREVAGAIPGARYAEVGDCGHFGFLEEPGTVSDLITDFFADRDLGGNCGAILSPSSMAVDPGFVPLGWGSIRVSSALAGGRSGFRPPWLGVDPGFVRLGWGSIRVSTPLAGGRSGFRPPWLGVDPGFVPLGWGSIRVSSALFKPAQPA